MSGFNSNFNDIQKQISFANLTDEQIQELMSILQTKRNVKPKLTKEERVFYQCCREHRSYSANQDTDTVFCPVCGSIKIIKNGTKNVRQRYKCKDCAKTFVCLVLIEIITISCKLFVLAEYGQVILKNHFYHILQKILF